MTQDGLTRRASLGLALGAASAAGLVRATSAAGMASAARADPLWTNVDAAAAKLLADQATPGLSISVLRKGQFVYSKGFGLANLETQTATTPKSIFLIGSLTKQFTAASVMQLADAGKLSVDDPLSKYFPDWPRGGEITLRHLLTMTSGLKDFFDGPNSETVLQAIRLDYDAEALYKLLLATKPLYISPPGTVWAYNSTGYQLLGLIVQKLTGEPYGVYYKEGVIARAGLADTAVDDTADVVLRRASGYAWHKGEPGRWDNAHLFSRTYAGPAGSMRSTSEDLCRWHEALLGGRVVSTASLKEMITPNRLKDGTLPLQAPEPGGKGPAAPVQYGFGLEMATIDGRKTIGHVGHISGFTSILLTFPDEDVSIAMIANCDDSNPALLVVFKAIIAAAVHADFSRRTSVFYQ